MPVTAHGFALFAVKSRKLGNVGSCHKGFVTGTCDDDGLAVLIIAYITHHVCQFCNHFQVYGIQLCLPVDCKRKYSFMKIKQNRLVFHIQLFLIESPLVRIFHALNFE